MSDKEEFNKLGKWKEVASEDVVHNRWLRVREVSYELPNGKILEHYYIVEKNPVVVIIPIRDKGQVYVMKEYERGVEEVGHKLPAGRVDTGESIVAAAKRELGEEMGMKVGELVYLGETYVDPGFMSTRAHFFVARDCETEEGMAENNPFELFTGEWMDMSELKQMIGDNQVKNPFVISGFSLLSAFLENE